MQKIIGYAVKDTNLTTGEIDYCYNGLRRASIYNAIFKSKKKAEKYLGYETPGIKREIVEVEIIIK